jgi:ABC-type sugar transport system ATPase subunit
MLYFRSMAFLEATGLHKEINGVAVVNHVSFTMEEGVQLAIAGETGSGKTSLLKMLGGLLQRTAGTVLFEGKKVLGPDEQLLPGHKGIAYLGQHFELRNNYRVEEELDCTNQLSAAKAQQLYTLCQVEHLLKRRTNQLSGGERQRIALAKQLATAPRLLLLDEPFSNLDRPHKNTMKAVIADIAKALDITCILVSHEPADILSWASSILVMQNGLLIQQDTPEAVYRQPVNEYTAGLLGDYNLINTAGKRRLLRPEEIMIATAEEYDLKATVSRQLFAGDAYILQVQAGEQPLLLKINQAGYMPGDTVYLWLPQDGDWYL